jgi:phage-related protein (TIGR01555 family)
MSFVNGVLARIDSWASLFTGLGMVNADKATTYLPQRDPPLDVQVLEAMFSSNDFANRICSALPDRALKQGYGVASAAGDVDPEQAADEADELVTAMEAFGVQDKFREADIWGRCYGLGGVLIGAEGSGPPDKPLIDERVNRLLYLMVVDRREMTPYTWYRDPEAQKFGEVESYRIIPSSMTGSDGTIVHESRVIRFGGALTSRRDAEWNQGCDYSVLQRVFTVLQQAEQTWGGICHLMTDVSQGVFSINGLINMLATGNEALLQNRMQQMQVGRSVARAIVLDADKEKFERVATPLAGIPEVLEQTWKRVAAAAEMPLTVLMGVSPAGLNATGESDIRIWYDSIQAHREHVLQPRLERIARLMSRTLGHGSPDDWHVTWPSLWQMSAPEQADYRLKVAQADHIYITDGVLLPEEVALSRFRGKEFDGAATQIDVEAREAALKQAVDELVNPPDPPPALPPPGQAPPPQQPQLAAKPDAPTDTPAEAAA